MKGQISGSRSSTVELCVPRLRCTVLRGLVVWILELCTNVTELWATLHLVKVATEVLKGFLDQLDLCYKRLSIISFQRFYHHVLPTY